ncbi:MAG: hypothetical protein JWL76_2185 [Thermoleophilia bacterium]|nr:hypothetical protein [Thermoleophilia bacterium]
MKLTVAPTTSMPAPTEGPSDVPLRAPSSTIGVPTLDDGSASASASLNQVASYVGMLHAALGEDPSFYARLVKRGFLESAIEYTRYALSVVDYDKRLDNDGFEGMIEGAVLEALIAARNMGTPTVTEPNLADELRMAGAAASNAAKGLETLVTGA